MHASTPFDEQTMNRCVGEPLSYRHVLVLVRQDVTHCGNVGQHDWPVFPHVAPLVAPLLIPLDDPLLDPLEPDGEPLDDEPLPESKPLLDPEVLLSE